MVSFGCAIRYEPSGCTATLLGNVQLYIVIRRVLIIARYVQNQQCKCTCTVIAALDSDCDTRGGATYRRT